jgi:hypothetical protein
LILALNSGQMSKGVWYMLIATFFFSAMNVAVKMVPHIPAVEIVFFSFTHFPGDQLFDPSHDGR